MINSFDVLKPGEKLIASMQQPPSKDDLNVNKNIQPAFDMYFISDQQGNYSLIIFMRIRMIYIREAEAGEWTIFEKNNFENNTLKAINGKWGGAIPIKMLNKNKRISLDFRFLFTSQESAFVASHWTLTVRKLPKRYDGYQSFINNGKRSGELDDQDLLLSRKPTGAYQRGIVHEFGHMLDLYDEYHYDSKYHYDTQSIMNTGEIIRQRHRSVYMNWLQKILKEKNIN